MNEDSNKFSIPLLDNVDIEILMHKDVHFSSNFSIMLKYYMEDGVGSQSEFSIKRIKKLMEHSDSLKEDLSEILLPEEAKLKVEDAKKMYLDLREVYEKGSSSKMSIAISDLILTEEEYPEKEIETIVSFGKQITALLIDLIKSDKLYDPIYPGYGRAPLFAATCLGKIEDEKAIAPLFQGIKGENFFVDEAFILALTSFKEKAEEFLLKRVKHKPFSKENEHAAIALTSLKESEKISKECLNLLSDPEIKKHVTLANYLILGCSMLKSKEDQNKFQEICKLIPGIMKHEVDMIARRWLKSKN